MADNTRDTQWVYGSHADDPALAVRELGDTLALVDDLRAVFARIDASGLDPAGYEDFATGRRELANLRRRLEAIYGRLA